MPPVSYEVQDARAVALPDPDEAEVLELS